MKKYLLLLLLFLSFAFADAQNKFIDSLQKVLLTQKEDTNKVNTSIRLAIVYRGQNNTAKALQFANKALMLSDSLHFETGKGRAYLEIGFANNMQRNLEEALNYYRLARQSFQKAGHKNSIAISTMYIGSAYAMQRLFSEAQKHYFDALKEFEAQKDSWGIVESTKYLASLYYQQENFPEAIKHLYKILKYNESIRNNNYPNGNKYQLAGIYQSIGANYFGQGNFEEALSNFLVALKIRREIKDDFGVGQSLNSAGRIYVEQGKYEEGLKMEKEALDIFQNPNMPPMMLAFTHSTLAKAYELQGDAANNKVAAADFYKEALAYFNKAIEGYGKLKEIKSVGDAYMHVGNIYFKLNNTAEAKTFLEKGFQLSKEVNNKDNIRQYYLNISKIYELEGDYKNTLANYKNYIVYKDSLQNEESTKKSLQAKVKYEFSKREDSLRMQQEMTDEKLKQQQLLAVQQQQQLQIKEAALQLSNQQKELNHLAFLNTEAQLHAEQSQREEKEKQLLLAEKEKALQLSNLKLAKTELNLKEKEVKTQLLQRNMLLSGSIALSIFGLVLYRNKQQKQKVQMLLEKQQMRTQIASDLHDEIGSTLTSISFFSEAVKMHLPQENGPAQNMLDKIGANARTVVGTMKDIVWVINPNNDISESLIARMKSHMNELCNDRNISYQFKTEEEALAANLDLQQRKNIYLIYKEAVHNAVKYAGCNQIHISFMQRNGSLNLQVQDNGKGFDAAAVKEGNGLANMKRRAQEIGACFSVQSDCGKGTCVEMSMKIT